MNRTIVPAEDTRGPALPLDRWDVRVLVAIVAFALLLRLMFFRGLLSVDDFNYLRHAAELWKGHFSLANVLYLHGTRPLVFVPVSWMFHLFGPSEASAVAWPLAASLGTVALVYLIGRSMFGRECGLYAGVIAGFLPLLVEESTRVLPGAIMNLIIALSVYAFLVSERAGRARWLWLLISGVAFGSMPLTGELGLIFGCFFPLAVVVLGRHRFWSYWIIPAGFLVVLGSNSIWQWLETGNPLFKLEISHSILTTEVPPFRPFFYIASLVRPFAAHGGIFYLSGAGALWAWRSRDRRALFLTAWFGTTWLLLEYLSSSLTDYRPLYKYVRYASILSIPGALLSSLGLIWFRKWIGGVEGRLLTRRRDLVAAGGLLAVLLVLSLHTLRSSGAWAVQRRAQLESMRTITRSWKGKTIYVTHWLWNTRVGYFMDFDDAYAPSGYHPYHALTMATADPGSMNRYVQTLSPGDVMPPGLLILDERLLRASLGLRHENSVGRGEIPPVLAEPPPDWILIAHLTVSRSEVSLYEIPDGARWPLADGAAHMP